MPQYLVIIRPSMDGPFTDTLWHTDFIKERMLKNRFLPEDQQIPMPPDPNIDMLAMRARLNNAELLAFESEEIFTFESMDQYVRNLAAKGELESFFKRHRVRHG